MTDRELLELAARAAGLIGAEWQDMAGWGEVRYGFSEAMWSEETGYWNPLVSDGDALRLAVDLNHAVEIHDGGGDPRYGFTHVQHDDFSIEEPHNGDPCAATRRAIVRAAAAMAQQQEEA